MPILSFGDYEQRQDFYGHYSCRGRHIDDGRVLVTIDCWGHFGLE
jgi:hypothetical protein